MVGLYQIICITLIVMMMMMSRVRIISMPRLTNVSLNVIARQMVQLFSCMCHGWGEADDGTSFASAELTERLARCIRSMYKAGCCTIIIVFATLRDREAEHFPGFLQSSFSMYELHVLFAERDNNRLA